MRPKSVSSKKRQQISRRRVFRLMTEKNPEPIYTLPVRYSYEGKKSNE